jgi:hypothetical protein
MIFGADYFCPCWKHPALWMSRAHPCKSMWDYPESSSWVIPLYWLGIQIFVLSYAKCPCPVWIRYWPARLSVSDICWHPSFRKQVIQYLLQAKLSTYCRPSWVRTAGQAEYLLQAKLSTYCRPSWVLTAVQAKLSTYCRPNWVLTAGQNSKSVIVDFFIFAIKQ